MSNSDHNIEFRIKENSIIASIAAWKLNASSLAIVIGKTIHLHKTSRNNFLNNEGWLKHELCHVRQFKEMGFWTFIYQYLMESVKNGYYNNRFEKEARAAEKVFQHKGFACLLN